MEIQQRHGYDYMFFSSKLYQMNVTNFLDYHSGDVKAKWLRFSSILAHHNSLLQYFIKLAIKFVFLNMFISLEATCS